jgi:hypothetical protein
VTVTDLAHEAAKRYCAAILSHECVEELLERLGVPAAWRAPEHVEALMARCRPVMEAQLVERFTVAELAALARFYNTPEGLSLARKGLAFTSALGPMLEAEIVAWASSVRPQAGGAEAV